MKKFLIYWVPLVLYSALIVYLSLVPEPPQGPNIYQIDKLYHFAAYFILGLLLAGAISSGKRRTGRVIFIATLAGFSFGVLMEICQTFVPGRTAEALDALANGMGALLGSFFSSAVLTKKQS